MAFCFCFACWEFTKHDLLISHNGGTIEEYGGKASTAQGGITWSIKGEQVTNSEERGKQGEWVCNDNHTHT
jgi:hypothetical protein